MRYLLAPVVLVALLFAAPAYAKTIVMECVLPIEYITSSITRGPFRAHFKYEKPLFGEAKVFIREDGRWREIAATIADRGAVSESTIDRVATGDRRDVKLKKGDEFQTYNKWVYDFEFFRFTHSTRLNRMDGSLVATDYQLFPNPRTDDYRCKKPDESWADRAKR